MEHIDDDLNAIAEIYRILKRGGLAHIEVPADPGSFDPYDEVLLHFRRYHLSELIDRARAAGFIVKKATHFFFSYPLFKYAKMRNRRFGRLLAVQEKENLLLNKYETPEVREY